ncbi:MAG TPA: methyltransferase domain-containing protein [Candidatus Limnocylindrales bacterium]|jgi:magnesium-protoporphyrin O-methyltransferase|nr:methyltransferase domain-containing protein [Candidatus Limnocylindrales bacterium]
MSTDTDGCGCDGFTSIFDRRTAEVDLQRYRRKGPDGTTRMLLDMISASGGVRGASILDIGAGVGVIDHESLHAGAGHAVLVDGSLAYQQAARDEGRRRGQLDRMEFVDGDFVSLAPTIDLADIVTLDRVICCYPDVDALVSLSAAKARLLYGLVLPRDRGFLRFGVRLINLWYRLRRDPYRAFAHPNATVDALAAAAGLRPRAESGTFVWRVVLYERAAAPV